MMLQDIVSQVQLQTWQQQKQLLQTKLWQQQQQRQPSAVTIRCPRQNSRKGMEKAG